MTKPYEKRLEAIREMLARPSPELVQEGYDLLFKLWLENTDKPNFIHDLAPVALKHPALIKELERRLGELSLNDTITDTFLKKNLMKLNIEVEKIRLERSDEPLLARESLTLKMTEPERQRPKYALWQIALFINILISLSLLIILPNLYQKIVVLVVALLSGIFLMYILPKQDRTISTELAGIKLNYTFPTYLSLGDHNIVHISLENSGETEFTGAITLVFNDPDSLVLPAPDQNLSVKVSVPSLAREAKQFKFMVVKKPSDNHLNYCFHISRSDGIQFRSGEENFLIAPVPYLRSTGAWLFSTAGLGALIFALLWEELKKLLFGP